MSQIPRSYTLEEVPLGSGGGAPAPRARHCLACAHAASNGHPHPPHTPHHPHPSPIATPAGHRPPTHSGLSSGYAGPPESHHIPPSHPAMMSAKPEHTEVLEDRDPNSLNTHLQIVWDDIIGEPEGARSPECAWRLSNACFTRTRNWCYTILAVLVAPPCALCLGCCFACLAFEQIWCTAPCLRCHKIFYASARTCCQTIMAATVVPVAEAFGHCFRHIRLNVRKDAADDKDVLVV